jgi:hypothetical protein
MKNVVKKITYILLGWGAESKLKEIPVDVSFIYPH